MRSGSQAATPGRPTRSSPTTRAARDRVEPLARAAAARAASRAAAPRRGRRAGGARRPARPAAATTATSSARAGPRGRRRRGRSRPVGRDVQHRALGQRADDLVRARSAPRRRRGASALGGSSGWKPKCGPQDWSTTSGTPRAWATSASAGDVGGHAVVGRARRRTPRAPSRCGVQRGGQRLGRDAVGHAELVVVLRRDERRQRRRRARGRRRATRASCAGRRPARRAAPARGTARGCPASRRWSGTTCAARRGPRRRAARRARRASATGRGRCRRCPAGRRAAAPSRPIACTRPGSAPAAALVAGDVEARRSRGSRRRRARRGTARCGCSARRAAHAARLCSR